MNNYKFIYLNYKYFLVIFRNGNKFYYNRKDNKLYYIHKHI